MGHLMDLGLNGKVAIVTGGSEGIGRATAILFAQEGASVAIGARRQGPLDEAQAAVEAAGGDCLAMSMDVTSDDDCERLVADTIERFGGVDILINNAGQSSSGMIESHDIETWAVDLDLKLYGAIRLAKLCAPSMRERGGGRIVNLLNIGCKTPGAGSMPTAASRAAGLAMTKALSKEVASDQILVNAACIGSVDSAQWHCFHQAQMPDATYEEFLATVGERIPVKRIGTSEEAANMIVFLASGPASFISGCAINIDGGASPAW